MSSSPRPFDGEGRIGVVFDLDGVLLDSRAVWERVLRELLLTCDRECDDLEAAFQNGQGDNSLQWATCLRRMLNLPLAEEAIIEAVSRGLLGHYAEDLPLVRGAEEVLTRLSARYPLGLASSSPRDVIAYVLERAGFGRFFTAWVSSDDVPSGKPAPDVFMRACVLLGAVPGRCVAIEDSRVGIRAAKAAGLKIIGVPAPGFALDPDSVPLLDEALDSLADLTPDTVERVVRGWAEPSGGSLDDSGTLGRAQD